MKKRVMILALLGTLVAVGVAAAAPKFSSVKPKTFDPKKTNLAANLWVKGIGCPTNSKFSLDGVNVQLFTDPACPTGDPKDSTNTGLLLAKTGPTANFAAATATLSKAVNPIQVLGYDLRKAGGVPTDPRGSHCSSGAPRFDFVDVNDNVYFLGCNSPAPTVLFSSDGWIRLRWGPPVMVFPAVGGAPVDVSTLTIEDISLVQDEGQDVGPDNFGLAILDNIDINGTLIGK